jgi:hypothetical protein
VDQMQGAVGGHAEPSDASGVLRNLGLMQDDVEQGEPP